MKHVLHGALMLTMLIMLNPSHSNASPINKCFENETNAAHIALCAGKAYLAIEAVRVQLEKEAVQFAKEMDKTTEYKRALEERSAGKSDLEDKINRQKNEPVFTIKNPKESNITQENIEEYQNIARINSIRELFEEYRDAECTRQAQFLKSTDHDKLTTERICLYDMTKKRIDGLEATLSQKK